MSADFQFGCRRQVWFSMAASAGLVFSGVSRGDDLVPLAEGAALLQAAPSPMKPYVKELRTPAGVQVLDDAPPDHPHHHGLMMAVNVNGIEFWAERPPEDKGRQVVVSTVVTGGTAVVQSLRWTAPGGIVVLEETRRIHIAAGRGMSPTILTWASELRAPTNLPAELAGRHYLGLGMRFVGEFAGAAQFEYEDGAVSRTVRGTEKLTAGRWCAVRVVVGGRPVTVAMFDDPYNPRHPNEWFTMVTPFAYLSATLGLQQTPLRLAPGSAVSLRWGVALWDGDVGQAAVANEWARWAKTDLHAGSVVRQQVRPARRVRTRGEPAEPRSTR